jgi:hypothetical protein
MVAQSAMSGDSQTLSVEGSRPGKEKLIKSAKVHFGLATPTIIAATPIHAVGIDATVAANERRIPIRPNANRMSAQTGRRAIIASGPPVYIMNAAPTIKKPSIGFKLLTNPSKLPVGTLSKRINNTSTAMTAMAVEAVIPQKKNA